MSVQALAAVFKASRSKGAARLVLLALADVANDEGEVSAYKRSHTILASKANVDERTVTRAIADAVQAGELEVTEAGDGRRSANYRIVLPGLGDEGWQVATPPPARCHPRDGEVPPQGWRDATPIIPSLSVEVPSFPVPSPAATTGAEVLLFDRSETEPFDVFWKAYPRKVGKPEAVKAWKAAAKATPAATVMDGLALWAPYWAGRGEPEFIPHPATWLRQRRWDDLPPAPAAPRMSHSTNAAAEWLARQGVQ